MKIFYSCQQAHEVISQGLDHELNLGQRTNLAIHLGVCRSCANFKTQMQTIRMAMKQLANNENAKDHHKEEK